MYECTQAPALRSHHHGPRRHLVHLQVNQCQFDLQTVKDFIAETKREPKNEDLKFQNFIREERARVEEFYQERFNTLIDSENVRQAE